MQLADDRCWGKEGWAFTGRSLSYKWDKVYCYYPPYSLLPYCQHLQKSDRGAEPKLYERSGHWRPKRLYTAEYATRNPRSGLCSKCSNIKRVYDKRQLEKSVAKL